MYEELLRPFSEVVQEMKDSEAKIKGCAARGHPFSEIVIRPYRPGSESVLVECTNCGDLYERSPTGKEIREYRDIMRLEFTI